MEISVRFQRLGDISVAELSDFFFFGAPGCEVLHEKAWGEMVYERFPYTPLDAFYCVPKCDDSEEDHNSFQGNKQAAVSAPPREQLLQD